MPRIQPPLGDDRRRQMFRPTPRTALRLALFALAFATSAFAETGYAPRMNFGARLEPIDRILHGAGQDAAGYATYAGLLPSQGRPALYMTYIGVTVSVEAIESWARQTRGELAGIRDHRPVLQIGLWLTGDGKPQDDKVAAGAFDAQIDAFARVLQELDRPALVRIGYEFEGAWNGYRPETFKASWRKIATALRTRNLPVALVWCAAGPAAGWTDLKTPLDFYPGDEWVDWWGIDLFAPHDIHDARTHAFLDQARAHRKPVLIGESSPKGVGVLDGEASWKKWYAPYFQLLRQRPEIKGFCYINWEWAFWAKKYGFNWDDWGDCRIEKNVRVRKRWQAELRAGIFQHGLTTE